MNSHHPQKSLIVRIAVIGLIIGLLMIATQPFWIAQSRNLRRIDRWRAAVAGQANAFAEKEKIRPLDLGSYTGGDGLVWVEAGVKDEAQEQRLRQFLLSLYPPRPFRWNVKVIPRLDVTDSGSTTNGASPEP